MAPGRDTGSRRPEKPARRKARVRPVNRPFTSLAVVVLCLAACGPADVEVGGEVPGFEGVDISTGGLSVPVPAGATMEVVMPTRLRAAPRANATSRRALARGARVTAMAASGAPAGWYKVRHGTTSGWVPGSAVVVVQLPGAAAGARRVEGVSIVYLVPSDRAERPGAAAKMKQALQAVQSWTARAGDGRTFAIVDEPVIRVVPVNRTAAGFNTPPPGSASSTTTFQDNAVSEAFAAVGGNFAQPRRAWIIYVDAEPACGSLYGGAAVPGGTGVAVLPAHDILGLLGQAGTDTCTGAPRPVEPVCRWVGGLGHELGHALGVPHPTGCDAGLSSCDAGDLMWLGYTQYPNTAWNAEDRARLAQNPLFGLFPVQLPAASCP
ncbi:MAG: hypothetical protein RL653_3116 [Pseudomonadota bacterium]